jgi:hypothetical protein
LITIHHEGDKIAKSFLRDDSDSVSDEDAAKVLATIEKEIHRSPNWARYAMNGALIGIGIYKPAREAEALEEPAIMRSGILRAHRELIGLRDDRDSGDV